MTKKSWDPLLLSLVRFAELYSRPITVESLAAGLPTELGSQGPELFSVEQSKSLFSRAALRAGFTSNLVQRELDQLSNLLLPCILVLKDKGSCILEEIDEENKKAKIILPDVSEGEEWVGLEKLEEEYLGFAFLLKRQYNARNREKQLITRGGNHWF